VSLQPFLVSEKRPKRDGELPMLVALVSPRKCPRLAEYIAPQFHKFIWAVETLDERFDGSNRIELAPLCGANASKSQSH
jgi:hypothetical protein